MAAHVQLHGSTSLDGRFRADPEKIIHDIRPEAIDRGRERLWVEKVEIQTRPVQDLVLANGPIEEIRDMIARLRDDPNEWPDSSPNLTISAKNFPPILKTIRIVLDSTIPNGSAPRWGKSSRF